MDKPNITFSDSQLDHLAHRFKILSEPSRLRILRCLLGGEKCVGEISELENMLQANVSKHLKIMQHSGIVECRRDGLQRYYRVIDYTVVQICSVICAHHRNTE
ncbi:MAG: ArsR/SmtB family transcription factor [Candidatus Kapaibacterium sp.]